MLERPVSGCMPSLLEPAILTLKRVLSDRENKEYREKSGNLVDREKSMKSQGS